MSEDISNGISTEGYGISKKTGWIDKTGLASPMTTGVVTRAGIIPFDQWFEAQTLRRAGVIDGTEGY